MLPSMILNSCWLRLPLLSNWAPLQGEGTGILCFGCLVQTSDLNPLEPDNGTCTLSLGKLTEKANGCPFQEGPIFSFSRFFNARIWTDRHADKTNQRVFASLC